LISKCSFLNQALSALDIPCIVTEQYPKALGSTVPEIELFASTQIFEKKQFSMLTEEVENALSKFDVNHDGEIDFDEFVEILKISTKDKTSDSYLSNRNILY
jgi:Ca2+-binding EF-hand superfamily protein